MKIEPTGMSTSGERETWTPGLTYRGVDLSGERVQMRLGPDPYIAAIAAKERAKGRVYVQKACNEWRREVGMPSRQIEVTRETSVRIRASVADFKKQMAKVAATFNPGAPDGRNNWEDEMRDRIWFIPDEPRCGIDCSDEPTPIYDQLQRERGAA